MHWQAVRVPQVSTTEPSLFHLEEIFYSYPGGKDAIQGVSFTLSYGEKIALVGQNGSGKTTLAKILCGLISPTGGRLYFKRQAVGKEELRRLRREVGILFQDPDDHLFCTRLVDDVTFGPLNYGVSEAQALTLAAEMLDLMGLSMHAVKAPHHLSYGQRKRAALASILACGPSVLILDEPTANLDAASTEKLLEALSRFSGTLICISHDLIFLHGLCRRALVLHSGFLHHDMDFADLIAHRPSLREHGLDFTFRFQCCRGTREPNPRPGRSDNPPAVQEGVSVTAGEPLRVDENRRKASWSPTHASEGQDRPIDTRRAPLLELENYSYRYPDGTWGLRGVSLCIRQGERIAVLGENGAGKSTLASVLVGVKSGFGIYRFGGRPVQGRVRKDLWRSVGIVFQDSMDQMVSSSAFDEVAFGLKHLGFREPELSRRVRKALEQVGLVGMEDRVPHHLSAGERKRLSLAAVLAMEPQVLILDEPTANLDPENEERLMRLLDELNTTLVLISHDLCFVSALTDRTVLLHHGCLVQDLPTSQFLVDDSLHSRYGLDVTYHNRCCRQILSMHES